VKQLALPLPDGHSAVSLEACRKLAADVRKRKASFETRDYAKRRAAMLRHTRGRG
jgi:hypothetical protein